MLRFDPSGAVIGAKVFGASLAQVPTPDVIAQIEDALERYGVLIFAGQDITPSQQVAFSAAFATLEKTARVSARLDGVPEIFVVGNADGKVVSFAPPPGSDELEWHADHMHLPTPARASLLYCLETPPVGGETLFACMYTAFERLSAPERAKAEGLIAQHSLSGLQSFLRRSGEKGAAEGEYESPETLTVSWPLVRTHPRTKRKSLYFGSKVTIGLEGWAPAEAAAYLSDLEAKATAPELRYAHHWSPGDAVLWDNRRVLHAGTPFDLSAFQRRMHRTTWREDKPIT
ncbi:MAG: TauD/TfdA family dioxygenase [Roseobacter sp.]|nr:TauD/TfdA family dioxygenase [Roseobacter sp.]